MRLKMVCSIMRRTHGPNNFTKVAKLLPLLPSVFPAACKGEPSKDLESTCERDYPAEGMNFYVLHNPDLLYL